MSEPNMTSEIVSLRNENAVLKEELALAVYTVPPEPSARSFRAMLPHIKSH